VVPWPDRFQTVDAAIPQANLRPIQIHPQARTWSLLA